MAMQLGKIYLSRFVAKLSGAVRARDVMVNLNDICRSKKAAYPGGFFIFLARQNGIFDTNSGWLLLRVQFLSRTVLRAVLLYLQLLRYSMGMYEADRGFQTFLHHSIFLPTNVDMTAPKAIMPNVPTPPPIPDVHDGHNSSSYKRPPLA
ncbi:hypothetical protein DD595_25240 [Enterobacter cloacae complex sp. 4DZ3-17B2]|nr:hypothetical protein [Enterobacter cloacae complex sp. 4DZ3-17B2]RYA72754.1 hypothetical protein DD595_25240 [Enterobacter cloacae complex sp. 4DZ3-17B2]